MLELLATILGSGGLAAIVGLVGSAFTKWMDWKAAQQKYTHEREMAKIRLSEMEKEQAHALALADKEVEKSQVEGQIKADVAAANAFIESQKESSVIYGGWVDQLRGTMRPLITVFLLAVTTWFTAIVWDEVDGLSAFSENQLIELFDYMIKSIIFLTITAVAWWFGSRATEWAKSKK